MSTPQRRRRGAERRPRFAIAVTALFFALLYLPVGVVVLFSFNSQNPSPSSTASASAGTRPSSTTRHSSTRSA